MKLSKQMYLSVPLIILLGLALLNIESFSAPDLYSWNDDEIAVLKSLWIGSLPAPPPDPSNAFFDHPKAISLGKKFFFDERFSGNFAVSCATCHPANMNFADNLHLAHGIGTTMRRTMPLIGAAYSTWLFWDGRKDSLWAQALGPIENPVEHGFTRTQCAEVIIDNYQSEYEDLFGPLPEFSTADLSMLAKPALEDPAAFKKWLTMPEETREAVNRIYVNMGKAIAAFVRTILPQPSRFDTYVEAAIQGDNETMNNTLTAAEVQGLRIFIGKAKCTNCHNGPLFTNGDFHDTGVAQPDTLPPDNGRADGIAKVLADEFNCLGRYSDAAPQECVDLRFIDTDTAKYMRKFKTPTLRNVAERAPYMHAGQIATLQDVLKFYRDLEPEKRSPELEHGDLSDMELDQLEAFLRTLSSPLTYYGE